MKVQNVQYGAVCTYPFLVTSHRLSLLYSSLGIPDPDLPRSGIKKIYETENKMKIKKLEDEKNKKSKNKIVVIRVTCRIRSNCTNGVHKVNRIKLNVCTCLRTRKSFHLETK